MKVGYIGLGALGSQLALRMLPAHELCVWDMNSQAVARLVGRGARGVASAAEVAQASDVVLLCLPRSADVRAVLFSENGLAQALAPGKLVIDQTSGIAGETRAMAQELAGRGIDMLDAAVSASPQVVSHGQAKLMTAGPDGVVQRALPVLKAITDTVYFCGKRVGDGQAMKTVNNAMNAGCRIATLEIAALGRKLGIPLSAVTEALHGGGGRNLTTERMLPAIALGKASTDFALSLMIKDLDQALGLGMQTGVPLPFSSVVRGTLQIGANTVGANARLEDMIGVVESLSGTKLRDEGGNPPKLDVEAQQQLALLDAALQAACWISTLECVATGLQYGLAIERMQDVLTVSSGWSTTGRQLLARLATGEVFATEALRKSALELRQVAELAVRAGVPLLLSNAARMQYEALLNVHPPGAGGVGIPPMYKPNHSTDFA